MYRSTLDTNTYEFSSWRAWDEDNFFFLHSRIQNVEKISEIDEVNTAISNIFLQILKDAYIFFSNPKRGANRCFQIYTRRKSIDPGEKNFSARVENESGDVNEKRCFPCRDPDSGQPVGDGVPIFTRTRCTQEQVKERATENGNTVRGDRWPPARTSFSASLGS